MKVDCEILKYIHLDPGYALLSVQNCFTSMEMFNILDVHRSERLNDVQFLLLLKNISNLNSYETEIIFNLLDIDHSGEIEFDEFYLVFCMLIASKDSYEKEFIYRHSKSIFQLIDSDASGEISSEEFGHMGILFNFDVTAINRIFIEFDVSGDRNLDFSEFRLFTMACIDEARAQEARSKVKAFSSYHQRLVSALEPILRRFVRTDMLPVPRTVQEIALHTRTPFKPGQNHWKSVLQSYNITNHFKERRENIRKWMLYKTGRKIGLYLCCWIVCCDFCCLTHQEDTKRCKKCCCKCDCWKCWLHFLKKTIALCLCCCCSDAECCFPQEDRHPHLHLHRQSARKRHSSLTEEEEEEARPKPMIKKKQIKAKTHKRRTLLLANETKSKNQTKSFSWNRKQSIPQNNLDMLTKQEDKERKWRCHIL